MDSSVIPAVVFKNAHGTSNFSAADKDQLTVLSVSDIKPLTVGYGTVADKFKIK